MDNPRAEKVAVVTEVRERFERSNAAILTEYRGLTVKDLAGLRRTLRDAGSEYKIYKNTLVRFAANDLGLNGLEALLVGPTAIAFVDGDAAAVAKALRDYARTNPKLTVKGGVLGNKVMSVADATALADLPPREVVLARLAGALASPMQTFAGLLQAVPRGFAYGLKALIEKRGGVPEAPAESMTAEAPPAETPAESMTAEAPPAEAAPAESPPAGATDEGDDSPPAAAAAAPAAAAAAPAAEVEGLIVDALQGAGQPGPGNGQDAELVELAGAATTTTPSEPAESAVSATASDPPASATAVSEPAESAVSTESAVSESAVAESVSAAVSEPPLTTDVTPAQDEPASALVANTQAADVEPQPAAAAAGISERELAAAAAPEAVEPPVLEDAAEAAKTPALADEPPEVEPLAAHGIPAQVEPEILSVEPSPEAEPEREPEPEPDPEAAPAPSAESDAPAVDGESKATPPVAPTAPDIATPPAS